MPELVIDNSGFGEWRRKLKRNERKHTIDCRENVYLILRHHSAWAGCVAYDEFAQRVVIRKIPEIEDAGDFEPGPWRADHDLQLGFWLSQAEDVVCKNKDTLGLGVLMAAKRACFHPVREFLGALAWDGVARSEEWLTDFLGVTKTPYTMRVARYFLINMIARVMQPGCIMRSVPVLEGPQNRGKSTALRILAEPWFSDTHLNLQNKDAYQSIQGVWLYEISEMESFSRAEVTRVKAFVSSRDDNYRPPYEGRNIQPKRQVAFSGSTNESLYLRDWSGNTRFWPVTTEAEGPIKLEELAAARDQILAEAVALFRAGERRHPTRDEEKDLFAPEQEQRAVEHPWQARIDDWLGAGTFERTTVGEVLSDCLKFEASKMLASHSQDVGRILHRLGWQQRRESSESRRRYYERPVKPKAPPPDPSEVPF